MADASETLQHMIAASWDAIVEEHPDLIPKGDDLKNLEYIKNLIAATWSNNFYEYETEEPAVEEAIAAKTDLNYHLTELQNLATAQSVDKDEKWTDKLAAQWREVQYAEQFLADAYSSMQTIWKYSAYGLPLLKAYMGKISGRFQQEAREQGEQDEMAVREVDWREAWPGPVDSTILIVYLMLELKKTFKEMREDLIEESANYDSDEEWPAKSGRHVLRL